MSLPLKIMAFAFKWVSIIIVASSRHLSTLALVWKLILLSVSCMFLICSASRICNFCLLFWCSNIVVLSVRIFRNCVGHECFFKCWAIELVSERCIVSLLDRVVEVKPTYILLLLSEIQSPKCHLNWYITLVFCKTPIEGEELFLMTIYIYILYFYMYLKMYKNEKKIQDFQRMILLNELFARVNHFNFFTPVYLSTNVNISII